MPPVTAALPRSVAEAVADHLRAEIGSAALAMLAREGLVVGQPQRGFEVFRPTVEDLEEAYEIRIALETLATRRAATRLTGEDLAELRRALDEMAATELAQLDAYVALNAAFHARIYAAATRPRLATLIGDLRGATSAYLKLFAAHQPNASDTQHEHEAILPALERRDPEAAARAMEAHLRHTVDVVRHELQDAITPPAP